MNIFNRIFNNSIVQIKSDDITQVKINGTSYCFKGNSDVSIVNGKVTVNGETIDTSECTEKYMNVVINGNVKNLVCSTDVTVNGDVNAIDCNGDVKCNNAQGNIHCNGDCTVNGEVHGSIDCNGDFTH